MYGICKQISVWVVIIITATGIVSCGSSEPHYAPKPKGYNRIDLPAHQYRFLADTLPYEFQYSRMAEILPDTFAHSEPYWIFVNYPRFQANIQITYKKVANSQKKLHEYIDDAYKLAGKHQIRASGIQEQIITTKNGHTVTMFRLEGEVPSPYQFYTTDSVSNFLRGAVYFSTATKNDSLAPVIDYLEKDMIHLLNTLSWKEEDI